MGEMEESAKEEIVLSMTTGEDFETSLVRGNLSAVIIDSDEVVAITIESSLGYLIFHTSEHFGINYYAPRALLQGAKAHIVVQDQFEKFKLNETLNVRVMGPTNKEVKIILRID